MKNKPPVIGIKSKPEVDLEALDNAAKEEEKKAEEIINELEDEVPKPKKKKEEPQPEPPKIDYEAKFKESQKEALILAEQIKKAEEERNKKVEITEDFLKGKYPDWEDMTIGEQKAIRLNEELAQEVQELKNKTNQFNNDRAWSDKVEDYIINQLPDEFPKIVGKEEDFRRFATRPSRKGLPLDDLAKIFLFENPVKETKKSLFHAPGSAGKPEQDEGMDIDAAQTLMQTRPLEYMRLVRAGKIKIKI